MHTYSCIYTCIPTYVCQYIHTFIHSCMHTSSMSANIHTYVMGMSMNAVGMSIHPFQWNFYVLAGKYLHYLIFDDVIMLHH